MAETKKDPRLFNRRVIQRAIQVASQAFATNDPAKLANISTACSLLSIASNLKDTPIEAERLIRTASKLIFK